MQDIHDQELMKQYMVPGHDKDERDDRKGDPRGFVVRDAPWHPGTTGKNAPDTASTEDFPEFGASVSKPASAPAWGPRRK